MAENLQEEKPMYYEYVHGSETTREEADPDEIASLRKYSESGESEDGLNAGHRDSLAFNFEDLNINPREPEVNEDDIESEFELEDVHLARAHWIQLFKTNMQTSIVQQTFVYILQKYKHMRPIWIFSRKIDDKNGKWVEELMDDIKFRHHTASIQAALTMIMDSLDDISQMEKLCQEIGAHHFFYDAYEPHLELMHEGFIESMKAWLMGTTERLDAQLENAWNQFWAKIKADFGYGIALQRHSYLSQCVTPSEMIQIRQMWDLVKKHGMEDAGTMVTAAALRTYESMTEAFQINLNIPLQERTVNFVEFSRKIMEALNAAIDIYTIEKGFEKLPYVLKNFVSECIMMEVCPSLVRKAFMEGLINMLTYVLGDANMNEVAIHQWTVFLHLFTLSLINTLPCRVACTATSQGGDLARSVSGFLAYLSIDFVLPTSAVHSACLSCRILLVRTEAISTGDACKSIRRVVERVEEEESGKWKKEEEVKTDLGDICTCSRPHRPKVESIKRKEKMDS